MTTTAEMAARLRSARYTGGAADLPVNKDAADAAAHLEALEARLEKAREALEAACRKVCKRCASGNPALRVHDAYVHDMALSVREGMQDCDATAIRRTLAELDAE